MRGMRDQTFDVPDQIARIDRAIEEARKFSAERDKLIAEREKLVAEADMDRRDRGLAPWLAAGAVAGGAAVAANLVLRLLGIG